jgi:DNA helicase II / ATP-dependent DNA helicase PcrA
MTDFVNELNDIQKKAVTFGDGPLLILAGAGSGKTRVLVCRVAYLLQKKKADSDSIILVTFTNKAAGEMKERVSKLLPDDKTLPWAGTFHSFGARVLRQDGSSIGVSKNYVIYDEQDRQDAIKIILNKLNLTSKELKPSSIGWAISGAKNELLSPLEYGQYAKGYFQEVVFKVYLEYQKLLKEYDALDFDDLIFETVRLWQKNPEVLDKYREQYKYVLIDEYQDTNRGQYQLSKMLSSKWRNLNVVGDASQAIYGWRGANYRNLMNLKSDYPNLQTINLDQNYRSTQVILDAATSVISQNKNHPILKLWTDRSGGENISVFEADSESGEARFIVERVRELKSSRTNQNLSDFAVLYRTNAQSRVIEEALLHAGIPYVLIGGLRFYERKEIKDILSYLRLLLNPKDEVSRKRAEKLGKGRLNKFQALFDEVKPKIDKGEISTRDLVDQVLEITSYLDLFDPKEAEDLGRLENIKELRSVAEEFPALALFLENITLTEKESAKSARSGAGQTGAVTLMTLHSAKGLEFPVVFLVGMEEGLFPHSRALMEKDELEEERRLCYVGITRAREKLFLTYATRRLYFGQRSSNSVSRFIAEIPEKLLDTQRRGNSFDSYSWGEKKKDRWNYNFSDDLDSSF